MEAVCETISTTLNKMASKLLMGVILAHPQRVSTRMGVLVLLAPSSIRGVNGPAGRQLLADAVETACQDGAAEPVTNIVTRATKVVTKWGP